MAVLLSTVSWRPIFSHSRSLTTFPATLTPLRRNRNVLAMASNEEANYNLATNTKNSDIVRPVIANFPPSLWDDRFTSFNMDVQLSNMYAEEIKVLKEEARNMLTSVDIKLSEKLVLIDTIERLGLSYHFENEIQEQLMLAFNGHLRLELEENDDLFINSLQFRLLRQHALDAPSVSDKRAHIGTSNLVWDYFYATAGVGFGTNNVAIVDQLREIFDADWESPYAVPVVPLLDEGYACSG